VPISPYTIPRAASASRLLFWSPRDSDIPMLIQGPRNQHNLGGTQPARGLDASAIVTSRCCRRSYCSLHRICFTSCSTFAVAWWPSLRAHPQPDSSWATKGGQIMCSLQQIAGALPAETARSTLPVWRDINMEFPVHTWPCSVQHIAAVVDDMSTTCQHRAC